MLSSSSGLVKWRARFSRLITILPMPKLSPTTSKCKLLKWYVKEGMTISTPAYSLVCEIETMTLTNSASTELASQLEIEIQEEFLVAKLLCQEGDVVSVGVPIAILVEDLTELPIQVDLKSIGEDAYDQSQYQMAGWQAYVKTKKDAGQCGCS
jgi:pyruvate/2-oxoglutarate dehydrogenase complex dihydrolipoamide acyltransferase (E2) component